MKKKNDTFTTSTTTPTTINVPKICKRCQGETKTHTQLQKKRRVRRKKGI